jgi:GR25 family glycosyltransferase involved in LPS biosynthesis
MRLKLLFLTLKDFPERLAKQAPQLERLTALLRTPVEIYYGINGREVQVHATPVPNYYLLQHPSAGTALYNTTRRLNRQLMSPGEFGCAWSHWNIYKRLLVDPDADAYLVLEDDFKQAVPDDILCNAFSDLPEGFDLCRLIASRWYPYEPLEQATSHFSTYKKQFSNNTGAYIISKAGAAKLLLFMDHELSIPADDILSKINLTQHTFNAFVSTPILFDSIDVPSVIAQMSSL